MGGPSWGTLVTDAAALHAGSLGSDGHSQLHASANDAINTGLQFLYANDAQFGLGDGTTPDYLALGGVGFNNGFFDLLPLAFTQPGSDRAGIGGTGIIPAGTWLLSELGHGLVAPTGQNNGGDVHVYGAGAGATTLTLADRGTIGGVKQGCMGSMQTLVSAQRGGSSATGGPGDGQTFTLTFDTPWFASFPTRGNAPTAAVPLCQVGAVILLQVSSMGVLRWFPVTCVANNVAGNYKKVQYSAFGSGAVDACIPPVGQPVYFFDQAMLNGYGFKNPHNLFFHNLTLQSGSNTGTPLDGIGYRRPSGSYMTTDCSIFDFWAGVMVNGSPMSGYINPLGTAGNHGPQNTDHTQCAPNMAGNYTDYLYVTNSQAGGGSGSPARVTVGGGRDYWDTGALMSTPGFCHYMVADDGALQSQDFARMNMKSGAVQIYGCGVAGVAPLEDHLIDGIANFFKSESAGNWFLRDESKMRTTWTFHSWALRFEAGLDIDGAGNNIDFTERPYTLSNVTLTGAGGGSPASTTATGGTIGATLPQATIHLTSGTGFLAGGGIVAIQTNMGLELVYYSGKSGADLTGCRGGTGTVITGATVTAVATISGTLGQSPNEVVVGTAIQTGGAGPVTAITSAMTGSHFGGSLPATIHCTDLTGFPNTGQVAIASSTGTQIVTYTGISGNDLTGCSGGKSNAVMTGGGSVGQSGVTSQALNQESRVAFIDSDGLTIHAPVPQYTYGDLATPTTCTLGTLGFMRVGTLKRFPNWMADWDLQGVDRYVKAGQSFDLVTLGPGRIDLGQNDEGTASNKSLPTFLVRDAQPQGGSFASTWTTRFFDYSNWHPVASAGATTVSYGKVFECFETEFSQTDIGKTITCSTVAGGADTIADFIDCNHVIMSGTVTNHNTADLAWSMSDTQSLDDPRVEIRRGTNVFHVMFHSGSDTNPVPRGGQVELVTSSGGTLKVIRSIAASVTSRLKFNVGTSMKESPAGGRVAVTVNGSLGNLARILLCSPTLLVAQQGSTLTLDDDAATLVATGAIAAGSVLVDDGSGGVAQVALTSGVATAGQLVVGKAIKAASGGLVAARLCSPHWTP